MDGASRRLVHRPCETVEFVVERNPIREPLHGDFLAGQQRLSEVCRATTEAGAVDSEPTVVVGDLYFGRVGAQWPVKDESGEDEASRHYAHLQVA